MNHRERMDQLPTAEKAYFAAFIAQLKRVGEDYADMHIDVLSSTDRGATELHPDRLHLTIRLEFFQLLCCDLAAELGTRGFVSKPTEMDDDDPVGAAYFSAFLRDMRKLPQGYPMIHEELLSVLNGNSRDIDNGVRKLILSIEFVQLLSSELSSELESLLLHIE